MKTHILHLKACDQVEFQLASHREVTTIPHANQYTRVWTGTVSDDSTPSDIFSLFNFIDENDDSKTYIADIRSLNVGDIIVLGGVWYLVLGSGFGQLTANEVLDQGFTALVK